ncbi:MAG: aminoacyl-tRNA hydrolase [Candidatus Parcubacteria bacterium]|nr:aminoacyl-tRNA hydrolase [Candidatus Parcubacteria bacterium]
MHYIVGLGNPGEEYELTRHNTGRIVLANFEGGKNIKVIFPDDFMNNSGKALKPIITSKQKAKNLIVVHDDLDLPLGRFKIVFGKDSAGHKGVESVIKNIKTKDFIRIRVGISPVTPGGKIKKPPAEKVINHIIGKFKPSELAIIKKLSKKITSAIETIMDEGLQKAMSLYN